MPNYKLAGITTAAIMFTTCCSLSNTLTALYPPKNSLTAVDCTVYSVHLTALHRQKYFDSCIFGILTAVFWYLIALFLLNYLDRFYFVSWQILFCILTAFILYLDSFYFVSSQLLFCILTAIFCVSGQVYMTAVPSVYVQVSWQIYIMYMLSWQLYTLL